MIINIRNINDTDHYEIELVAKRAFWNLNMPGCDEHYLVHRLWNEPCYIPEISLAATTDEKVVGAILYSKAKIETDHSSIEVLTFGPLCVDPDHQKMGIGKKLLLESMRLAAEKGYQSIFICGVPTYYPKFGFKTADMFGITMPDGSNFDAFMGYELQKGALKGVTGKFYEDLFPVLSAENYIVLQGFAFDINADGEAVLHGYDDRSPDVVIPKKLMGADVTAIDDYAFFGDEAITALSLNSALSLKKSAQTPFTAAIAL